MNDEVNKFMKLAIEISIKSVDNKGGPFGCIIVKNNEIVAEGHNQVTSLNDPTAHGEIVAIRNACKNLNTFNLNGTVLYTSCEPCPMCLSAIYWSHIDKVYFGNSRNDASKIGFDDDFIYKEFSKDITSRKIPLIQIMNKQAIVAFNKWGKKLDKIMY